MTPGQKWRFRRNITIFVAHRGGLSQRLLADVFDLPRSRIGGIVKEMGALGENGLGQCYAPQPGFASQPAAMNYRANAHRKLFGPCHNG